MTTNEKKEFAMHGTKTGIGAFGLIAIYIKLDEMIWLLRECLV